MRTYFDAHFFYWFGFANVATSVVMSVAGSAPFNGTSDQNLSVAYISAFILVFLVNFFFFCIITSNFFSFTLIGNIISSRCLPLGCYGLRWARY